jgi:hypothetical protein
MKPETVDLLCMVTAFLAPIILIIYLRWIGLALGALVSWVSLVIAGYWLSALDPKREVLFLDTLWLFIGWIPSAIYATIIFGLRELIAWLLRMRHNNGIESRKNS